MNSRSDTDPALRALLTDGLTAIAETSRDTASRQLASSLLAALAAAEPAPTISEDSRAQIVDALAYALARGPLPDKMTTGREYAEALAPLVIESGYLAAAEAAPLDGPLMAAVLKFYADQMPAYAVAAGLDQEGYAAVMVDVHKVRAALAAAAPLDPDGDPIPADPHSEEWYDGYAAGQRDAAEAAPLDVAIERLIETMTRTGQWSESDARKDLSIVIGRSGILTEYAALAALAATSREGEG